jgi:hypothetical protein
MLAKARNAAGMPSDPPNEPPTEATVPPVEAVPPEPVSKVKEWAVAVAIMIVFAIICAQFIGFLRSSQLGGP